MKTPKTTATGILSTRLSAWQPLTFAAAGGRERATLEITGERFQTMDGFGGCFNELGWQALQSVSAAERQKVLRNLFDPQTGCRFNVNRIPIGASDYALEWYSLNETDGDFAMEHFSIARDRRILLPYIKAAQKYRKDMQFFASPWSPPTWLKYPKAHNYGTLIWKKAQRQAYALYFAKFAAAYAAEGVAINQLHVQNEPQADQKFPSCVWTGEQLRDFIRDDLGPTFKRLGVKTEIWLGTLNMLDYNGFPNTVLSDPRAAQYIAGIGVQWFAKAMTQRVHATWPELPIYQTENECGDGQNTWEYAQYIFELMHLYLTSGVNAYVYWNMVLPAGGRSTWGWKQNSMVVIDPNTKTVTYNPEFYLMKHLSAFVDPGAVRLGLKGPLSGTALAFANPNGSVVVTLNNALKNSRVLTLATDHGQRITASLPPQSFITLTIPPAEML